MSNNLFILRKKVCSCRVSHLVSYFVIAFYKSVYNIFHLQIAKLRIDRKTYFALIGFETYGIVFHFVTLLRE